MNLILLVTLFISINTFDGNWNFPFTFSFILSIIPLYFSLCDILFSPNWRIIICFIIQQTFKSINSLWYENHVQTIRNLIDEKDRDCEINILSRFITGCDKDGIFKKVFLGEKELEELYNKINLEEELLPWFQDINIEEKKEEVFESNNYIIFDNIDSWLIKNKKNYDKYNSKYYYINKSKNEEDLEFLKNDNCRMIINNNCFYHYGNIHVLNNDEKVLYLANICGKKYKPGQDKIINVNYSIYLLFIICYSPILIIKLLLMLLSLPLFIIWNPRGIRKSYKLKDILEYIYFYYKIFFLVPEDDKKISENGYYWISGI